MDRKDFFSTMTVRKVISQIHLWLELLSGLVVLVLGLTGCVYAFEEEIKALVYANKLKVSAFVIKITFSQNLEAEQQALEEEFPIQGVIMKNAP